MPVKIEAKRNPWVKKDKDGKETKMPGGSVSAQFNIGSNLQELIQTYGESVVYNQAKGALTVAAQGWLRSQLDQGKSQADIDAGAKNWKPGERKAGKSPREKLMEQLAGMSPEERAALLKEASAARPAPQTTTTETKGGGKGKKG